MDEWEYHQDGRDRAATVGAFVLAAIALGVAIIVISSFIA